MPLPISHLMRPDVSYCEENSSLRKISEKILKEKVGSIIVNRGEESIGIITTNDLLKAALEGLDFDAAKAAEIMSQPLDTFNAENTLDKALKKFKETGRTRLVILKEGKVVGIGPCEGLPVRRNSAAGHTGLQHPCRSSLKQRFALNVRPHAKTEGQLTNTARIAQP